MAALQADVWLGDSLGEMALYYTLSELALLGGSFEALGGQNLIEACALGTPVIVGPHTRNFADAVRGAVEAGVAMQISEAESSDPALRALTCAREWLSDQQALLKRSQQAQHWVAQHTGATTRTLNEISEFEIARAQALPLRG